MTFPTSPKAGSRTSNPVFLDQGADHVTAIAVQCDGLVLPIDRIAALHRHARRRHELAWALPPLAALAVANWLLPATALGLMVAIMWWRLPPLQLLDLTLRDGQRLRLLKTTDADRVGALHHAMAKALAHCWVQSETATRSPTGGASGGPSYHRAWRNTAFDEVHDSGPGALKEQHPQDPDIRL
jgi:hypothetical protein